MNGMGLPVERRVLHYDKHLNVQVLTPEQFVARRLHPAFADTGVEGIRLEATEYRPVGHDGATSERYPAVPVGHMREM